MEKCPRRFRRESEEAGLRARSGDFDENASFEDCPIRLPCAHADSCGDRRLPGWDGRRAICGEARGGPRRRGADRAHGRGADAWRGRVYAVRYFLLFISAGAAIGMISLLHETGGFSLVLGVNAVIALLLFVTTLALVAMIISVEGRQRTQPAE